MLDISSSIRNVLVTGGCGFVGSNVIRLLLAQYPHLHICNVDKMDYNSQPLRELEASPQYTFVHCDICDENMLLQLLRSHQVELVLHFAAQSHVDRSFLDPHLFVKDNIQGTLSVLEAARKYGSLRLLVHFSTDEIYGDRPEHQPFHEESPLCPTNPYSASKAGAEMLVRSYHRCFRLPLVVARCNNIYGPNQYRDKVIPLFADRLRRGLRCPVHGTGEQRRSFIHVEDVCGALLCMMRCGALGEVYNIGSDEEYSILQVVEHLQAALGVEGPPQVEFIDDRPYNDQRYLIDDSKLRALGWAPQCSFVDKLCHELGPQISFR